MKKLIVLLFIGALVVLGYHWSTVEDAPVLVEEVKVDSGAITSSINATGVIRSRETVVVSAMVQGGVV